METVQEPLKLHVCFWCAHANLATFTSSKGHGRDIIEGVGVASIVVGGHFYLVLGTRKQIYDAVNSFGWFDVIGRRGPGTVSHWSE